MKLTESEAFTLFDKYGILHPCFVILEGAKRPIAPHEIRGPAVAGDLSLLDSIATLQNDSNKLVVKADVARGGKKKAGLVRVCDASEVEKVAKEMGVPVIVEEYVPHEAEFFVALRATREGIDIYTSDHGGIDVEQNWDKVTKKTKPETDFEKKLVAFFEAEDATYLEINPYTEKNAALGVVLELDEAASYRHSDWTEKKSEGKIAEIDSQIKGSVKLVKTSGGNTAVMAGGAGAALFLCDAVINNGLTLANYAEFSGNPPSWALTELTKQVCGISGIKNLVIGSGIANFTDVKSNIEAIIEGLRQSPQAKHINIVVRRCGPGEEEGIKLMQEFAQESGFPPRRQAGKIKVFGRETGMTEIVKKLT